nr:mannose-1-phosphate guanylyltransferase/mannose-6-phosphate isomerase [Candidatus Pantoea persica]
MANVKEGNDFISIDKDDFIACPDESVDYAGWSDVGSWPAPWEVNDKDAAGNFLKGDTFLHNTKNCYINSEDQLVAAIGVENLIIVNTIRCRAGGA